MEQVNPYSASQVSLTQPVPTHSLLVPPVARQTVAGGLWYLAAAWYCFMFAALVWCGAYAASSLETSITNQALASPPKQIVAKKVPLHDDLFRIGLLIVSVLLYVSSPVLQLLGYVRLCRAPPELKIRSFALWSCLLFLGALALVSGSAAANLWLHKQPWLGYALGILGAICGVIATVTLTLLLERLAKRLQHPMALLFSLSLWRLTLLSLVGAGITLLLMYALAAAKQKADASESVVWLTRGSVFSLIITTALTAYCAVHYLITVCCLRRIMLSQIETYELPSDPQKILATPLPLASPVLPAGVSVMAEGMQMLLWGVRIAVAMAFFAVWLVLVQENSPVTTKVFGILAHALTLVLLFVQVCAIVAFRQTPREFQTMKLIATACWALAVWGLLQLLGITAALLEYDSVKIIAGLSSLCAAIYQMAIVLYLRRISIHVGDAAAIALTGWLRNILWLNILLGGVLAYFVAQLDLTPANFVRISPTPVLVGLLWLCVSAAWFVFYVATIRGLRHLVLSKLAFS